MKPIIGITGNFGDNTCQLSKAYYQSVLETGGSPLIIPPYVDSASLQSALSQVDAIILSGGGDLNPLLIGEEPIPQLHSVNAERDQAELNLIDQALRMQIPVLGICRGIQMLVAAMGGELYQDLPAQYHDAPLVKHSQDLARHCASHTVEVEAGTILHSIFNTQASAEPVQLHVNSFHHQAVKATGPRLRVSARSADGVIEAVESTTYKSILGVQWHPEAFIASGVRSP